MDLGLKDKVALVTGAGSQIGFGRAIALTLAKEGCNVVVNDVDLNGAQKTAAEIKALGCKAVAVKANITNCTEVKNLVEEAIKAFDRIDIWVNNAGYCTPPRPFLEMSEDDWEKDINVNLRGVIICTRAILPHMITHKGGKIVNIISGVALNGGMNTAVYAAAKAGVHAFSMAIAGEAAPHKINVNCVSPGPALTGFAKNAPPGMLERFTKSISIGRLTEPRDVANAVVFLSSDAASDIVGQTIIVTGNVSP